MCDHLVYVIERIIQSKIETGIGAGIAINYIKLILKTINENVIISEFVYIKILLCKIIENISIT